MPEFPRPAQVPPQLPPTPATPVRQRVQLAAKGIGKHGK